MIHASLHRLGYFGLITAAASPLPSVTSVCACVCCGDAPYSSQHVRTTRGLRDSVSVGTMTVELQLAHLRLLITQAALSCFFGGVCILSCGKLVFQLRWCACGIRCMFHRVFTPPCVCSTTDGRVPCSTVSLIHRVYVPPCLYSRVRVRMRVRVRHSGLGLGLNRVD